IADSSLLSVNRRAALLLVRITVPPGGLALHVGPGFPPFCGGPDGFSREARHLHSCRGKSQNSQPPQNHPERPGKTPEVQRTRKKRPLNRRLRHPANSEMGVRSAPCLKSKKEIRTNRSCHERPFHSPSEIAAIPLLAPRRHSVPGLR